MAARQRQRFVAVARAQHLVAERQDHLGEDLERRLLVVGDEHQAHGRAPSGATDVPTARAMPVSSPSAELTGASTMKPD